jgi:hypothetical protein
MMDTMIEVEKEEWMPLISFVQNLTSIHPSIYQHLRQSLKGMDVHETSVHLVFHNTSMDNITRVDYMPIVITDTFCNSRT